MTEMSHAEAVFFAAAALPAAARTAYLSRVCAEDDALRRRVERMLAARPDIGNFLEPAEPADDATGTCSRAAGSAIHPWADPPGADGRAAPEPTADFPGRDEHVGALLGGKYKLIEAIGEGGMGSVFMAQQTEPVKRAVAVKVIRAGMDSRAVLTRFEAERQALAMMDHPNIAKVLDAGTTESGRPFFVMELVKGTPITKFCDERRLTPRQRLELFVPVCQAIQHAHQKGVIHRDIKPSNVLVAMYDDRPVPKVIDFGVAKAGGSSLTEKTLMTGFGAVVGTPEYMSPEQANLNNLDIDTRSDVYSLGVLLYELLTGTTPVDRKSLGQAALLEILRIVREVEAPRPSAKLSTIGTLASVAANRGTEPAKLSRLMKGELDWVLMKALEKDRTRRYDSANALSRDVQRYLADEVVEARPPSAGYRLRKFVRRHKGQVIAATLVVVALLTGMAGTTVGLIEATKQEQEAKKQEGLARTEAVEKEAERAKAVAAGDELSKANLALTRSQEEVLRSNDQLLTTVARSLLRPLAVQAQPNQPLPPLNEQEIEPLWELAASTDDRVRLRFVVLALQEPESTRRLKDRAGFALHAAVVLDLMRRARVEELLGKQLRSEGLSPERQGHVALCLVQLGVRDRTLAGKIAATLSQAMTTTTDKFALLSLASGLSEMAAQLEPQDAATTIIQTLTKTTNTQTLESLTQGLSAVAARMEPKDAAQAAATITQAMTRTTDPFALRSLAQGLSAVAARMQPKDAPPMCGQAAATITQAMTRTTDPFALRSLAQGLSAVAARMQPKDATRTAATITQLMTKTTDPSTLSNLAQGLSAVAPRMEPKDATRAADTMIQAMTKTAESSALNDLAQSLSAVAPRMEPEDTTRAAATIIQAMTGTTDPFALYCLAQALSAVTARMEPKDAPVCGQAVATITQAMTKTTDPFALYYPALALSTMVARMEPKDAAQAAATITQAMTRTTDPFALRSLAQGLSAVAARMEPTDAPPVCGQAAATITQAMTKTTDPFALYNLAQALSMMAARMEPTDAPPVCGQAAATITQLMTKTTDPSALSELAQGLSAVAPRMEPKDATRAAATIIQAMSKTTESSALNDLAQALSTMAARMEPTDAAPVCGQGIATIIQATTETTDPSALYYLAQGLSAVTARMAPKDAAPVHGQTVATITQAITKTADPSALSYLARALSEVAPRLELKDAPRAAATLIQVMTKATDPSALQSLAQSLSEVAARMEPKDTPPVCGQAAATIIQAMSKTTDPSVLHSLAQALSAVLSREVAPPTLRRPRSVTAAVGAALTPGTTLAVLAVAQPTLGPPPAPLPAQMLVDLLKNPFCVGEARRMVLEQLGRHYNRPFSDQWEFVDYVHNNKLPLDLTTPPVRPL